jgi:hypothetical protein
VTKDIVEPLFFLYRGCCDLFHLAARQLKPSSYRVSEKRGAEEHAEAARLLTAFSTESTAIAPATTQVRRKFGLHKARCSPSLSRFSRLPC